MSRPVWIRCERVEDGRQRGCGVALLVLICGELPPCPSCGASALRLATDKEAKVYAACKANGHVNCRCRRAGGAS